MRKRLLLGAMLALAMLALADTPVVSRESVQIASKILRETRTVVISKPASYDKGDQRYPVLYLLDGETHFMYVAPIALAMGDDDRIPEMIVAAIESGTPEQRTRDLTPPSSSDIDNRFSPGNGGADRFLSFLENELIPYIDRTYRTRPYRMIVGHSFGGLFAARTMIVRPKLFQSYLLIDPSLHWNNASVAAEASAFLSGHRDFAADMYVSASFSADSVARPFVSALAKGAPAGFRWKYELMRDQTHSSIPLPSVLQGLDWIFDGWHMTDPLPVYDKGGIEAVHRHFREGGARCGFERTTPPFTVSLLVAGLIKAGRLPEAGTVLLHDPKAYPPPWNQLDALARAYEAKGDAQQARVFYELSLKRNPDNDFARRKLAVLPAAP